MFVRRKTLIGYVNINLKPNSNVISSGTFLYSKLVSTIHESVKRYEQNEDFEWGKNFQASNIYPEKVIIEA